MREHTSDKATTEMTFSSVSTPFYTEQHSVEWGFEEPIEALQTSIDLKIPISVFSRKAPTLQLVVKYLRECEMLGFAEIAEKLGRAESTVRVTYRNAPKESLEILPGLQIPISSFKVSGLSPLETLVFFLKNKGLRNIEVATLLNLDPRTTATVWRRAQEKEVMRNA